LHEFAEEEGAGSGEQAGSECSCEEWGRKVEGGLRQGSGGQYFGHGLLFGSGRGLHFGGLGLANVIPFGFISTPDEEKLVFVLVFVSFALLPDELAALFVGSLFEFALLAKLELAFGQLLG
jgi:hypothetical protein